MHFVDLLCGLLSSLFVSFVV